MTEELAKLDMRSPSAKERDAAKCRAELLDDATVQTILYVLLRRSKKQGRLTVADRTEILTASTQFENGNYSPGANIRHLLAETAADRELKRETPGQS